MTMLFQHYHALITLVLLVPTNAQWISPSQTTLPNSDSNMAIGYYQNTIIILGGYENPQDMIEYDIVESVFNTTVGVLPFDTTGYSQFYTQMDNMIYIIDTSGERINVFDVSTKAYTTQHWNITHDVDTNGCIASAAAQLYIIGGYTTNGPMNNVQILTITNNTWRDGPYLQSARYWVSCVASTISNKMYVVGGTDGQGNYQDYLKTIEFISITQIDQNQWQYTNSDLTEPLVSTRAVVYDTHIYVMGGQNSSGVYVTNVNIIDTITNTVSILTDQLSYEASSMAPIVVGHTLFAFGGWNGRYLNKWQYYPLPTTSQPSTSSPTKSPSLALLSTALPTNAKPITAVPTTEVTTSITVETTNETDLPSTTAFDSASTITLSTTHTTVETVDSSSSFVTEAADISNGVIQEDIDTTPTTLISAAIVLVICALLIWVLAYFVIRSARSKPRGSKQSAPQHELEMVVSTTGKDYSLHELDEICKEEKQEEGVIFTSKSEHEDETQDDDDGLRLDQGMFTCWQCGDRLIHTKGVKHGEGQDALCITCQLIDKRNNCTDESDDGLWDDMDDNAGQNAIVEVTTPRGETPRY
eukprot:187648_1